MKAFCHILWTIPAKEYTFTQERMREINLAQIPSLWGSEIKDTFSQKQNVKCKKHLTIPL